MDANSAWIRESGLTDLIDPNDPMSALFASGAFDNASVDGSPRMTLALGMEEDDLMAIDAALEALKARSMCALRTWTRPSRTA
jgi:hypothetical protein